jgi:acetyltransferase-like isoleucine patch superfamily enzyme
MALPVAIYLFPLACYHLHGLVHPTEEGLSYLASSRYSPWWGGHQLQLLFIAFPTFEVLLRLIPGAFSLWLKLWGSQVGSQVYWTPHLEILDRGFVRIGDGVVFGHRVGLYPHVIRPRDGDLLLLVKCIQIGSGCFVGAGCHLGPGVSIEDGAAVPVGSEMYPNQKYKK